MIFVLNGYRALFISPCRYLSSRSANEGPRIPYYNDIKYCCKFEKQILGAQLTITANPAQFLKLLPESW